MNTIKLSAKISQIIAVLANSKVILAPEDSIIIADMMQAIKNDTIITAEVSETTLAFYLEISAEDKDTLTLLQNIASKDGYKCFMTSADLGTNIKVSFYKGGVTNETNEMLKTILEQISKVSIVGAETAKNAEIAKTAAEAAIKAAAETAQLNEQIRAELLRATEATSTADVRHGSILAQLQQQKNNDSVKREETFFDTTLGKVTMWGGGAAAVGIVGYAAYTYFSAPSEA